MQALTYRWGFIYLGDTMDKAAEKIIKRYPGAFDQKPQNTFNESLSKWLNAMDEKHYNESFGLGNYRSVSNEDYLELKRQGKV